MSKKYIYALGFFDGVHLGHQALLESCRELAESGEFLPGAITFGTHPQMLTAGGAPGLINTPADREKLMRDSQREPTVEQIAKELNIPREEVVFAMDAIMDPVSLYEPVYSDNGGDALCVMDQVSDRLSSDESWIEQIALKDAVERLTEREKKILAMRFYQGKTQMEVSAEIGISQAQVSRLEKSAISSIKKGL